jgi:hypothetical protein
MNHRIHTFELPKCQHPGCPELRAYRIVTDMNDLRIAQAEFCRVHAEEACAEKQIGFNPRPLPVDA